MNHPLKQTFPMLITHFAIVQRSVLLHLPVNNGGKERQSFRVKKWQRLRRASFSWQDTDDLLQNNLLSSDHRLMDSLLTCMKSRLLRNNSSQILKGYQQWKPKNPSRSVSLGELCRILGERERTIRGPDACAWLCTRFNDGESYRFARAAQG